MKMEACREGGKKSAQIQKDSRRSLNEILFADLCKSRFSNVEFNAAIFDGWDADVVLHDIKIAVLWNGKWHYEKIGNHSLAQVQVRDKIKTSKILEAGFTPYVIKDLGKHNPEFVEDQFIQFLQHLETTAGWDSPPPAS
jgi:very-short-patch-repair endonuclease